MFTQFLPALTLAIALAMDAFAVALTQGARFRHGWRSVATIALAFGAFQGFPPLTACALIAAVTAALSAMAIVLGRKAGDRFGRHAEVTGGVMLIGLGMKIITEHTALV